ncbi:MAG: 16S rRNA (uracil(1498)-N(3))-methyltransferase, partial [Rhizobiales bacterium 32-66-8]
MAETLSRLQRLFVEDDLRDGGSFLLTPEQGHYLSHVIRLPVGGKVLLFNGRDGEWLGMRADAGKREVRVVAERQTRTQPPTPDLAYAFAPLKHARLDYMIQKAVEMGAGRLQPVLTRHTQAT